MQYRLQADRNNNIPSYLQTSAEIVLRSDMIAVYIYEHKPTTIYKTSRVEIYFDTTMFETPGAT